MNKNDNKCYGYLSRINTPDDLKNLTYDELGILAEEIRLFLLDTVSKTGGHIASNLGVVELTLALHKVLNAPLDKIIWDVGHQTYVHKILTGRKDSFESLRQFGGIAGFPKTQESEYDIFNTGHSSTSVSAALGMARARDLNREDYTVAAVIGDGALSGGMALEALNDAGISRTNLLVILNDNGMSIAPNVGGLSRYLSRLRIRPFYYKTRESMQAFFDSLPNSGRRLRKFLHKVKSSVKSMFIPSMFFEDLGFRYFGPIDGHDIKEMVRVFEQGKTMKGPVLVHVVTVKGKGYKFAEENPGIYHGVAPFVIESGQVVNSRNKNYSGVFGKKMCELAKQDNKIIAITAAMTDGTGLTQFRELYPKRFFDVGIAEQHAVTLAAGLAMGGAKPVVAIYSTFLQRAYDQILHDVALQNLKVVFAIDRAGVVGDDGETHQGIYDISFLYTIPNMTILSPASPNELKNMLDYAIFEHQGPVAVRYPKGSGHEFDGSDTPIEFGKGMVLKEGTSVTLIGVGKVMNNIFEAAQLLESEGISCEIINPRFLRPADDELILKSAGKTNKVVVVQDVIQEGGFGAYVTGLINNARIGAYTKVIGLPDKGIEHGKTELIYKKYGLDPQGIKAAIIKEFYTNN
ncbi:MAG TPA: 1-deoxy-D-xylulose-5-phosphate synthase [Clostridiaceae bacterium]|nr:1-deoxy-D-xylulose-5-phosphate synthase [Clostridiaceae bacterium]